ncbi:MAG: hypothetical protein RR835_05450 [Peptostreptococcaceae bacterium]
MLTIDIKDLKNEGYYRTTIIDKSLHRHRNLYLTNKDGLISISEKHIGFYSKEPMVTEVQDIVVDKQKTGFGYKSFFVCSECGERRTKLYYKFGMFICRGCCDENVYKYRTNIYDEGGEGLIIYKINKLAKKLGVRASEVIYPINRLNFFDKRPKYMRYKEFETILKQLEILEELRFNIIFLNAKYSASEINKLIDTSGDCND